ncbi:UNVERIFIED_CONTAM: hypothetical protein Scaly_3014000 [Sesamum calycinum]|uniref:Uncharacterized protein n=1 Tax=Sesamum calycinum TaxID=2727403 RepID=A0AAW2KE23_9LAMI
MVVYQPPVLELPVPIKAYRSVNRFVCIATSVVLVLSRKYLFSGNMDFIDLFPHGKSGQKRVPRRPPFSARNPRSWLCQHNIRAVPFILLCGPRPGPAFWEARSHRAHGPAGLPAVVGILPFPGQRLGWMRDLLHEERVVSTGCFRAAKLTPIRISSSKVPYPYARILNKPSSYQG